MLETVIDIVADIVSRKRIKVEENNKKVIIIICHHHRHHHYDHNPYCHQQHNHHTVISDQRAATKRLRQVDRSATTTPHMEVDAEQLDGSIPWKFVNTP